MIGAPSRSFCRSSHAACIPRLGGLSVGHAARVLLLLLLLAVMLLGLTTTNADAARSQTCSPVESFSARTQPACWTPFAGNSPFNLELPAKPQLASNSSAVLAHMARYGWAFQRHSKGFTINDAGSRPVYFAHPGDPVMTVNCTSEEGRGTCEGSNRVDVNGARIHVPAGARPGSNGDAHMTVVETGTGQEYDFWHASVSRGTLTAGTGSAANVNTDTGTGQGGDAASLSLVGGLLRPSELLAGHIDHPLVIDIPCTDSQGANSGYVWPASGGWGDYCGEYWHESGSGAPNIGQLFMLNLTDAQIARSGAPRWQRTIMTALAHYGAYAEDTNGSCHDESISIFMQSSASWTSLGQRNQWASAIAHLGGSHGTLSSSVPIPISKLEVVNPCVPQGTCPRGPAAGPVPHRPERARAWIAVPQHRSHPRHRHH